jgi:hypothetical protein
MPEGDRRHHGKQEILVWGLLVLFSSRILRSKRHPRRRDFCMGSRYQFKGWRPQMLIGRGRHRLLPTIRLDNRMPSPQNRPVPRFAPEGSVTLITALDIFGRAVDPAWTGEEIKADTAPEPSDEHLANLAFARLTSEAADDTGGEVGDDHLTEQQILDALYESREMNFAVRRRWKAAAIRFMCYLHQGMFTPSAIGNDGRVYEVPSHLWASEDAENLFDNGGHLEVRSGQLAAPRGLIQTDTATVLVNADDLQQLITAINEGTIPPAGSATTEHADPYHTGLPGRPTIAHLIVAELRRRIAAGECEATANAEAKALQKWASSAHPNARTPTEKTIENRIRSPYNTLFRRTK